MCFWRAGEGKACVSGRQEVEKHVFLEGSSRKSICFWRAGVDKACVSGGQEVEKACVSRGQE